MWSRSNWDVEDAMSNWCVVSYSEDRKLKVDFFIHFLTRSSQKRWRSDACYCQVRHVWSMR